VSLLLNFLHANAVRRNLIVLLPGALLVLAFAPFGIAWLAPLTLAGFLLVLEGLDSRQAGQAGFMFGFALFAAGTWWLYVSLNILGGLWPPVALLLMFSLMSSMGLYVGLTANLLVRLTPGGGPLRWLLAMPALWVITEWLRGWLFSGFPWLSIGYSQTDTPLAALAPAAGIYGVTWGTLVCAGVLVTLLLGSNRQRVIALLTGVGLAVLVIGLGGVVWTDGGDRDLRVRLVQGAVPQELKWQADQREPTLQLYRDLSLNGDEVDLIVWPEAAIPALPFEVRDFLLELNESVVEQSIQMLVGILTYDLDRGEFQNTLWAIGEEEGMYHKRHLVAFGEYFPLPDFARRWLRIMNLPSENILPGEDEQPLLQVQGIPIAATICYEIAYGAEQLQFFPEAELMVNVSNDAWFGNTIAPHQHLQIGRMRALETGRYLLRATNTGITAVVNPQGEVTARLPQFESGVIDAVVRPYTGATLYVRAGNWLILSIMCLLVAVAWRLGRQS
jgi:apolipoprotein N-acyltransferase